MNLPFLPFTTFQRNAEREVTSTVLAVGLESVGKTQLLSRLSGRFATPENFRGSTLACESYTASGVTWVDTPGIYRYSETESSRSALDALATTDRVLLVVRADRAIEQLQTLLPLVEEKAGILVLTFSDRLPQSIDRKQMERDFQKVLGVPVFAVDARKFTIKTRTAIRDAASDDLSTKFRAGDLSRLTNLYPTRHLALTILEKIVANPLVALLLLLLPAIVAVTQANRFADWLYDPLTNVISPLQAWIESGPSFVAALFSGDYGLCRCFPFSFFTRCLPSSCFL